MGSARRGAPPVAEVAARRRGRDTPDGAASSAGPAGEPEQVPDLVEERLALEGLGDVSVRPGGASPVLVERLEGAGQQQHRDGGVAGSP